VKTHVKKLVVAHDTARVIECLLARGDEKVRDALYNELKNDLTDLIKSKYAVFFVQKLVNYGTKDQKARVLKVK
jgi:pumilio family protein 6